MIDCRFKPITAWPNPPTTNRTHGPFKATWQKTLDLLEKELGHLDARDITIEAFFRPNEIRNDGWPRSDARPTQPGVILSFETEKGRFVMPCDRFLNYQANARAIALTLEHLRGAERYGVAGRGEQYTGWLRLPAASATDEAEHLAREIAKFAGADLPHVNTFATNRDAFDRVWKEAVRQTHPDTGGNVEDFNAVIAARDRLRELKGWT